MNLTTQPYKGTRDYYPEDKRVQNYIFAVYRRIAERYGYEEYGAPLLEPYELYAAKTSDEIVGEQTYQFVDRGGRNLVIRPELTPSISRMVAARRQEMAYPARLYNIANFMRYERPQRGREREFWQLNVDIFGVEGVEADAEIIQMAYDVLVEFGATPKDFTIKINSRKLVNSMMADYLGLSLVQSEMMIKLFDRRDKITPEEFIAAATEIFGAEKASEGMKRIGDLNRAKSMAELPQQLLDCEAIGKIKSLFAILRERGVANAVFDITLMRGFDYYTDTVFEVYDTSPENRRSLFGGGRYDGLVGLFGVEPLPTVGMAPGVTAVENFLTTHNLLPDLGSTTDLYMIVLGDSLTGAQALARRLRAEGVRVAVDITSRKLDKQIKTAVKLRVPYLLFVGADELREELYTLKDVAHESEQRLSFERVVTAIQDYRNQHEDDFSID